MAKLRAENILKNKINEMFIDFKIKKLYKNSSSSSCGKQCFHLTRLNYLHRLFD